MTDSANFVLDMSGVTKTYAAGETRVVALNEVDFQARAGQVTAIMGPSGAGKTTFLTLAGALLRPTSGRISVAGIDITELSEKELPDVRRRRIGFIFQSFNLLESLTSLENVTLVMMDGRGKGRAGANRASELLAMLGLSHRLKSLPKNLSGGEKQRVAIGRALANNPDLILADEPTANLDAERRRDVMLLLRQIAYEMQKSVVIVSHDHRIREVADRVLWLEDGVFKPDPVSDPEPAL